MKVSFFAFLSFLCAISLRAQPSPIGYLPQIGKWQSFLHYNQSIDAVAAGTSVFFATELGIVEIAEQYEYYYHNKITGLSDMGIAALAYSPDIDALVIAYKNGNIDVKYRSTGRLQNLPAILQNNNIVGSKRINRISVKGAKAYFSCDFGLVELDLSTMLFGQTTFTGSEIVWAATQTDNAIYIATDFGIFKGARDGRNLQDFSLWEKQGTSHGLSTDDYSSVALFAVGQDIYAAVNDTLVKYDATAQSWQNIAAIDAATNQALFPCNTNTPITRINMSHDGARLYLISNSNVYFEFEFSTTKITKKYFADGKGIRQVVSDQYGTTWAADYAGPYRMDYQGTSRFSLNGPTSDRITSMTIDNQGHLWATSSPVDYQTSFFDPTGFFRYNKSEWKNFNSSSDTALNTYRDAITVAANPRRREVFIGSFMDGIIHLRGDSIIAKYTQFNTTNGLQSVQGDNPRTRVTGMAFDSKNNCWITNSLAPKGIVVRLADGTWRNFDSPFSVRLGGIAIDRSGYKWVVQESSNLFVFDEGDIDDVNDDRYFLVTTNNSELASNNVNCVTADLNGTIWVGTTNGVTIFSCGESLFDGACLGSRPVVNPDNFLGRLMEGENINSIAIDGANRKWLATNSGVFLLSEDGYTRIHYFNNENSVLPDNQVNAITVDGSSGMVYMATGRGLVGYRGEATTGKAVADKATAYAFPNPVRPEYVGTIAITGLPTDSNVKITDISGQLVHETTALGGQAVWDGQDYTGRRTATGVYLVFAVSPDGTQKLATKILFVK
jgi:ligand-binding sensor domain-containing protein